MKNLVNPSRERVNQLVNAFNRQNRHTKYDDPEIRKELEKAPELIRRHF